MITIYEEQRQGAVANTVEHAHASLQQLLTDTSAELHWEIIEK
ncbi:hypothetical protein [Paenibacillus sp. LC231]|nr:hypothetical protein [Paenibacillus sp. LC231]